MTSPSAALLAERMAPHYIEAEEAVLGSILINPQALRRMPGLRPEHFYIVRNGWIFAAMQALSQRDEPVDFLTVRAELERGGRLQEAGGPAYLTSLLNAVPTALHAEAYAGIVLEAARRRGWLEDASALAQAAYEGAADGAQARQAIESARARLGEALRETDADIRVIAGRLFDELANPDRLRERLVPWGLAPLDEAMGGGQERGTLALVAARPSMGKSAALSQITFETAQAGLRTLVVTQEHTDLQWARRMAFAVARQDWLAYKQGRLSQAGLDQVNQAVLEQIAALPYLHIDGAAQTSETLLRTAWRLADRWGSLDVVITDHLALFLDQHDKDYLRVGQISRNHKLLARELDCIVIAACQLSRKVEERNNKRPILSDLRDSGEIEQNADDVWGIYRAAYYDQNADDVTEFLPLKMRDGNVDASCRMVFVKENARFERLARPFEMAGAARRAAANGPREPDYDYLHDR